VQRSAAIGAVVAATVLLAGCGSDDSEGAQSKDDGVGNPFSLVAMAHTFADTSKAWDGDTGDVSAVYVSAPCNFDAPVNNNSTNLGTLNARLPGSTSPSSARMQPVEFQAEPEGDGTGRLEGTMSMTVCQTQPGATAEEDPVPDPEKDHIVFSWSADYEETSPEEIAFSGTFDIEEGTGPYEGITGTGEVGGYFTCAWGDPAGCASAGEFRDMQLVMIGSYEAPAADD
jgi:outer membrane murein-binding lipoprotein Lpp